VELVAGWLLADAAGAVTFHAGHPLPAAGLFAVAAVGSLDSLRLLYRDERAARAERRLEAARRRASARRRRREPASARAGEPRRHLGDVA
jgi:hypothetical protein